MYQLNPNLKHHWKTRKPYKLLKGGRFSSKTQDAGGMAAFLARNYSLRFLCIRQFQNRITDSVYTVIKDKIEQAGWTDEFDIGVSSIKHKVTGSEFLFYGIARNIADIKGTEGVDICWIEEGEGLTENQWSIIDPTIRKEGAEIWLLWNPDLISDFVQTKLPKLLGDDCIITHINYDKNPFLSKSARDKAVYSMKTTNNQGEGFTLEIEGDSFIATGNGFVYVGQGDCRKFTQTKKLPSIRIVKSLVKALVGQSCMK